MIYSDKTELIFLKWKAELANMDRSKDAIEGNFDLLFHSMHKSKVPMSEALPYLDRAIKSHYPSDYVVKSVYKTMKKFRNESLSEFESNWKEFIDSAAKRVFFSIYDIDNTDMSSNKKFGNMSASEYRKQQKYADAHPTIDWESIIREQQQIDEDEVKVDASKVNIDINLGDL
jgi:hypothetical protein